MLHLGNGASATAVDGGRSVDTSMGFTPLEGLVMGTRSGDVDPALPAHLHRNLGWSVDDVNRMLNRDSGLKGLVGHNDFRELVRLREEGDADAELAFDVYCHRLRQVRRRVLRRAGRARRGGLHRRHRGARVVGPRERAQRDVRPGHRGRPGPQRSPGEGPADVATDDSRVARARGADERGVGDRAPVARGGRLSRLTRPASRTARRSGSLCARWARRSVGLGRLASGRSGGVDGSPVGSTVGSPVGSVSSVGAASSDWLGLRSPGDGSSFVSSGACWIPGTVEPVFLSDPPVKLETARPVVSSKIVIATITTTKSPAAIRAIRFHGSFRPASAPYSGSCGTGSTTSSPSGSAASPSARWLASLESLLRLPEGLVGLDQTRCRHRSHRGSSPRRRRRACSGRRRPA